MGSRHESLGLWLLAQRLALLCFPLRLGAGSGPSFVQIPSLLGGLCPLCPLLSWAPRLALLFPVQGLLGGLRCSWKLYCLSSD